MPLAASQLDKVQVHAQDTCRPLLVKNALGLLCSRAAGRLAFEGALQRSDWTVKQTDRQ